MIKFVNLTPHSITFITEEGNRVIEPSGTVARLTTETIINGYIGGIPVTITKYGEIEGLPDPDPNCETIYIVSSLVAGRCHDRDDVYIPNESVRDSEGRIIGCKSLGRI